MSVDVTIGGRGTMRQVMVDGDCCGRRKGIVVDGEKELLWTAKRNCRGRWDREWRAGVCVGAPDAVAGIRLKSILNM